MSSASTSSLSRTDPAALSSRSCCSCSVSCVLQLGGSPVLQLRGLAGSPGRALGLLDLGLKPLELLAWSRECRRRPPSRAATAPSSTSPRSRRSASSCSSDLEARLATRRPSPCAAPRARSRAASGGARARRARRASSRSPSAAGRRLVDEVDRLVGQEAVGDVAVATGPPPRPAPSR